MRIGNTKVPKFLPLVAIILAAYNNNFFLHRYGKPPTLPENSMYTCGFVSLGTS